MIQEERYIDLEKLKVLLSELKEGYKQYRHDFYEGAVFAVDEIVDEIEENIDSLQQGQSESDIEKEIYKYIKKEFGESWDGCVPVSRFDLVMMANHFYKRGLKVRK